MRPKLDAWGAPIVKEGGVGPNIMSPVYLSTAKNKAINKEALRLGLKVTDPSRTVAGERLTKEQFHRYRATAGQLTAKGLVDLMATQAWRSMDDEKQRKAFDMKADSRKAARDKPIGIDTRGLQ